MSGYVYLVMLEVRVGHVVVGESVMSIHRSAETADAQAAKLRALHENTQSALTYYTVKRALQD